MSSAAGVDCEARISSIRRHLELSSIPSLPRKAGWGREPTFKNFELEAANPSRADVIDWVQALRSPGRN